MPAILSRSFKKLLIIWVALFLQVSVVKASQIAKVLLYPYKKLLLISVFYKDFPVQELTLALKEQKYPVYIVYTFEVYKKRFLFFKDILLHKGIYFQELFYDPERNLYCFKDNINKLCFKNAEKAVIKTFKLESYPFRFKLPSDYKSLYLKVKVRINYKTHLSDNLRYTHEIHDKILKMSKIVDLNEALAKP